MASIEVETFEKGTWFYLRVNRVWESGSVEHLITFDKAHSCSEHARAYTTTKMFKAILKSVETTHTTYNQ